MVAGVVLVVTACAGAAPTSVSPPPATTSIPPPTTVTTTTTTVPTTTTTTTTAATTTTVPPTTTTTLPPGVTPPPDWLGTRPLEVDGDGTPLPQPTPSELSDRRFTTTDILPPPPDDGFHSTIGEVPADVVARSTWEPGCPVPLDDLSYVTVSFVGFDGLPHTGEMILGAAVAEEVVGVFADIHAAGFPIEQMMVTTPEMRDAEPTGDSNITESFVCRPVTGGTGWSQHAYGLAIDVNPFHNPYLRGEIVLPELAGDYLDRNRVLPGMIVEGDEVTSAFDAIGWGWGGRWSSIKDWQHFSLTGR